MRKTETAQDERFKGFQSWFRKCGAEDALPIFLKAYKSWPGERGGWYLDLRGKQFADLRISGRIFPVDEQEAIDKFIEIWRAMEIHGREMRAIAFDSVKLGQFVRAEKLLLAAGIKAPIDDFIDWGLHFT